MKFEPELAFWVVVGGGAGSLLRYVIICLCAKLPSPGIPLATLIANVAGCLAIGILGAKLMGDDPNTMRLRAGLLIGVLGGFTTFSTFAFESHRLFEGTGLPGGLINIAAHNVLGLMAVAAGIAISKQF